jgi:hypothetical protein
MVGVSRREVIPKVEEAMSGKAARAERKLTEQQAKHLIAEFTQAAMKAMRRWCGEDLKRQRERFPDQALPCSTCAFRAFTDDWQGTEKTTINLLCALLSDHPFYCHVSPVTGEAFPIVNGDYAVGEAVDAGEPVSLCQAWTAIAHRSKDDIYRLIAESMAGHPMPGEVPPEFKAHIDQMVGLFN